MTFHVRAEFNNVLNNPYLPDPTSGNALATQVVNLRGVTASKFGFINSVNAGGIRNGQLVARFEF